MSNPDFPRVLIFSQTFNDFSGGGITLTNLFKGYPKEHLAVLTYPFMLSNVSFETCDSYYQIGREEYKWAFPFYMFKKTYDSGRIEIKQTSGPSTTTRTSLRNRLSADFLTPLIRWTGLSHGISEIKLSEKLKKWITEYSPGILYLQISNRESIVFSVKLIEYLKIPAIIHMMDDWPSTISSRGPMKSYWNLRIDREFRELLARVDLCLSISDAMSEEYLSRYGRQFIPFHNPVNPAQFKPVSHTVIADPHFFKIIYLGRIGKANQTSLLKFARFISTFHHGKFEVELDIFTKDTEHPYARKIKVLRKVNIKPAVDYAEVPVLMNTYDLLLLPLDFTASGLRFSRLSMPTKASEYMMSGVPMLVFAPPETAVFRFCSYHNCGYCISSQQDSELALAMNLIINNKEKRMSLAENARNIAAQLFDSEAVRKKFKDLLVKSGS